MQVVRIPETGFLRLKQVLEVFPVSKSHWYEGCKSGKYPAPIKLSSQITVWRASDIRKLIEEAGK